ncbi:MAG: hypothetical protein PVF85_03020 [Anaerolineales bacterium]|jgi:hypothetical protein
MKMRSVWQSFLLLIICFAGLLPACGVGAGQQHDQDDAILLMISSYTVLLEGGEAGSLGFHGGGRMLLLNPQVRVTSTREVDTLIDLYSDLYESNLAKIYEQYPERAEQMARQLETQHQEKIDDLLRQKQRLRARRRRRRWGLFRRIGRGLARVARFIGRTTRTIVVEGGRLLAQYAVNEIKQRVRDVFEGRVNVLIERVASKFGPLAPFVQGKLKHVLERWWIRLRDRVSGRLARQRRETQTAEARAALQGEPARSDGDEEKTDLETVIDPAEFAGDDECEPDRGWISDYWEKYVVPALKEDGKNCSDTSDYFHCLEQKADEGLCPGDAHAACELVYEEILPTGAGQVVTIVDDSAYYRDGDNHLEITFPLSGGPASGYMHVNYSDDFMGADSCVVDHIFTYTGKFDPNTCTIVGTAMDTFGIQEEEEGDCLGYPDSYERSVQFGMEIRNGVLYTCGDQGEDRLLCESYRIEDYLK